MTLASFFAWWNLLFELVFLLALIYTLLLAFGAGDADEQVEADLPTEIDAGMEADFDTDLEHPFEAESSAGAELSAVAQAVAFLGVGRVPVSLVLVTFCYVFGFTGWASNMLFIALSLPPVLFIWGSLAVALAVGIGLTRLIAFGLARVLPSTESYGVEKRELVGRLAEVRYPISHHFGAAQVRDQYGNLHQVDCRVSLEHPEIPSGARVVLLDYDPALDGFNVVTEEELEERIRRPGDGPGRGARSLTQRPVPDHAR
jgi:hypothetical protein